MNRRNVSTLGAVYAVFLCSSLYACPRAANVSTPDVGNESSPAGDGGAALGQIPRCAENGYQAPCAADVLAPGTYDAGKLVISDECRALCVHLRALGCVDGDPQRFLQDAGGFIVPPEFCEGVCQHVQNTHITNLKIPCILEAGTQAAAVACGSVNCVR